MEARMHRIFAVLLISSSLVFTIATPASASHVSTAVASPEGLQSGQALLTEGDIKWVANAQAGHGFAAPMGETQPFTRDGKRYLVASDSVYGLTVVDVTDP